jgi:hypothetical protein
MDPSRIKHARIAGISILVKHSLAPAISTGSFNLSDIIYQEQKGCFAN